jgi:hypothetical protein
VPFRIYNFIFKLKSDIIKCKNVSFDNSVDDLKAPSSAINK